MGPDPGKESDNEDFFDYYALLFGVRRSIRYHNYRRAHYERAQKFIAGFSVIFGSATVGTLIGKAGGNVALFCAATVTVLQAFDFVVGPDRKARLHEGLSRRYSKLETELVRKGELDDSECRELVATRLEIEANEPPVLRVLDAHCHNELCRALDYDEDENVEIGFLPRLVMNFLDVSSSRLVKKKDIRNNSL